MDTKDKLLSNPHTNRGAKDNAGNNDECVQLSNVLESDHVALEAGNIDKENDKAPRVWISNSRRSFHSSHSQSRCIRALLVILAILSLLLVIFIALWSTQKRKLDAMPCLEPKCITAASDILRSMDPSISPCDDFYQYACNGWVETSQMPPDKTRWSPMDKLTADMAYFSKKLLENTSIENPSHALKMAQTFYNSCMNTEAIESLQFKPIYDHIAKFYGGWSLLPPGTAGGRNDSDALFDPSVFNLTAMYLPLNEYTSEFELVAINVGQERQNVSNFVITFSDGSVGLPREYYTNESSVFAEVTEAYKTFMRNYSRLLGVPEANLNELDEIFMFEKTLAHYTKDRLESDTENNYEIVTLKNLSEICPILDWKVLLQAAYKPLNFTIQDDQQIALTESNFFQLRCKIFKDYMSTKERIKIIHNAAVWNFIWKTTQYTPQIMNELLGEYKKKKYGSTVVPERWKTCVENTQKYFGRVIGRWFVNEKFDKENKDVVLEMTKLIRQTFKENFATVSWMHEADKLRAIEKVEALQASVGYPSSINDQEEEDRLFSFINNLDNSTFFKNFIICMKSTTLIIRQHLITKEDDQWDLSPDVVNAFYKDTVNRIYFPAGILQSPIFESKHPVPLNYGGIGMVIGHEITHAFDQNGAKRDANGNLRQWWSRETEEAFVNHSQCMIDQYSNYSIYNMSLNGKLNLGENIADNGGLIAAYKAFKKLQAKHPDNLRLPGLDFTPDQLFFLAFSQVWCIKTSPDAEKDTILFDVHTVHPFRVIGTLSNSEDFARAFNCPLGSRMNPVKKCKVW